MRDGFGRKLSDEEAAKITGKPAQTEATGHHAKPHVRSLKEGSASADPVAPSDAGNAKPGSGLGREREIIDEP